MIKNIYNYDLEKLNLPDSCPVCGGDLEVLENGMIRCINKNCEQKVAHKIEKCLDNNFAFEYEVKLQDGHIEVNVTHHDGTNCFEIYLLSKKGIKESSRPIYEWEKDYEPKPYWFKKIWGYLY
jgi:NAD-dependent DNA ligase